MMPEEHPAVPPRDDESAHDAANHRGDHGRAGRNLPAAIGVGVCLGAVALASLYTIKEIFLALVAAAIGFGIWEITRAFAVRSIAIPAVPLAAGAAAMLVGAYLQGVEALCAALAVTVIMVLAWRMPGGAEGYLRDSGAGVLAAVYVPFFAGFVSLLLAPSDGADRVVTFIAVTVCSDIGGYVAGVLAGRHPLAPRISPKKTWEGSAGAAVACMICGGILLRVFFGGAVWQGVLLGFVTMVAATVGDLIESLIKRDLGIKDMGSLLPGHGGVMDRLDSLVITAPTVWLLLSVFVPPS